MCALELRRGLFACARKPEVPTAKIEPALYWLPFHPRSALFEQRLQSGRNAGEIYRCHRHPGRSEDTEIVWPIATNVTGIIMPEDSATLEITALREAWLSAVRSADADRLASLVTDDVMVIHRDGRWVRGRNELKADFLKAFEFCRIDQQVVDPEIAIRGDWAFEIAKVDSALTPACGGEAVSCGHNDAGRAAQAAGGDVEGGSGHRTT